ncbi:hypothetical protein G4V62_10810 [Bacillaceae bacterium SIJ1]|uniref:hypothetical protein n=1 Tax=Litoribacterium kuwaitense TaxID=1398745 RepID=UPI0013EC74B7|nr:hypothetical protein [Litoribacterium kuwaitense]NGP45422.1 hypothetical protein [Litoribacterium kuwaitense]
MFSSNRLIWILFLSNLVLILGVQQYLFHSYNQGYEGIINTAMIYTMFLLICATPYLFVWIIRGYGTMKAAVGIVAATLLTMGITNAMVYIQSPAYTYNQAADTLSAELADGEEIVQPPATNLKRTPRQYTFRDFYAYDYLLYSVNEEGQMQAYQFSADNGSHQKIPLPTEKLQAAGWMNLEKQY